MVRKSHFFIFGDQSWPVESLAKTLPPDIAVSTWVEGKGWLGASQNRQSPQIKAILAAQHCELPENAAHDAVAIVGFQSPEMSRKIADCLRERRADIKVLEVGSRGSRSAAREPRRSVAWHDLMSEGMEQEIQLLSVQRRVQELRDVLKDADRVAILLQDDPDPDGLASALALRKILNRNSQTAPIVSFGRITRPENVAMSRLLGIEVEHVNLEQLHKFSRIMLVDCQPSFFKGRKIRGDVIIDHHPRVDLPVTDDASEPIFVEIREDLGSLSTLLTQYLRAANVEVSQRLATALLYGIKTDTLVLNREVSGLDLDAFVYLYPLINYNVLRRIERPELPLAYLDCLRKGLKYMESSDGVVVLMLGEVTREEWIPQAADFALQVEGSQWAMGCGVIDGRIVISGRNCGYVQHCGDLFKQLFDGLGCAGGHRTMAKAIIALPEWEKRYGKSSLNMTKLPKLLATIVNENLSAGHA
ncbi:MAG: DHH family phosphoesterase [Bdellovibrionales bacterium]|nr:DHH family phosphoesterase [Bdellovibrionales bacterium]